MIKKSELLAIAKDRTLVFSVIAIILLALTVLVVTIVRLNPSDVQIPVRYSDYGTANIYRSQWFALYIFPAFSLIVAALNIFIVTKIYSLSRLVTLGFTTTTLFILILSLIVTNAILNLAPTI